MTDNEKILKKFVKHRFGNSPIMYNEQTTLAAMNLAARDAAKFALLFSGVFYSKIPGEKIEEYLNQNHPI